MAVGNVAFSECRFGSCRTPSAAAVWFPGRAGRQALDWLFTLSDTDLAEVRRRHVLSLRSVPAEAGTPEIQLLLTRTLPP